MPRYTRCPFYIDESRHSISCEDVCRSYDSMKQKWAWMDMYCDSWDWQKCPYAVDRAEAYRRYEEGDRMALENNKIEALEKECHRLRTKLGKVEKRVDRQQKKIDEQRELIKSYQRVNEAYEKQKSELYRKWRQADQDLRDHRNKAGDELSAMAELFEQRMAYLIDTYCPDGKLKERAVKEWAGDKEFAIVADKESFEDDLTWMVIFQEEESNEDTKDQEQVQE